MCLHAKKNREGVEKTVLLAVGSDESVPEEGARAENAVEDGGGVERCGGDGGGVGNEVGDEEVVLLEAFVDDGGVDLVEVFNGLAGLEEGEDARS